MKSGIYSILNTLNSKIYIGSSYNIEKRWSEHKRQLISNKHYNKKLQLAWNKYSEINFIFSVIEFAEIENLIIREQFYLDTYLDANLNTNNFEKNAYNILRIAGSTKGHKLSIETKNKIKDSLTGEGNPFYGKKHSDETKIKMSLKKIGINNPHYGTGTMLGRKFTKEHKDKISISNSGANNKKSKKVLQYSLDNIFIKEWNSGGEVARVLKISQGSISSCCLGNLKTAYGYIWKFK
jgi:group I intron endonuclease